MIPLKTTLAAGLLCLPLLSVAQQKFAETITAADLQTHLRILAADDMEGRETGTPGQRKAAEYIARQFADLGLKPPVPMPDGKPGYQQSFTLHRQVWGDFYVKAGDSTYRYGRDFVTNGLLNVPTETTYETVFVGYGITEGQYDDYAGLDVRGKAVVILDGEPAAFAASSNGADSSKPSKWKSPDALRLKVQLAREKGAAQVFVAMGGASSEEFRQLKARRLAMTNRFNRPSLKPATETIGPFGTFFISREMAASLLGDPANGTFTNVVTAMATTGQPTTEHLTGRIQLKAERKDDLLQSSNVLGFLEGTDKKDEVVVVSAHYDHIGIGPDGQVNNGANDDGSGTVSVLEIAQAFAKAKAAGQGPRRSMLFLTVSGEEKGLLGSEYYADVNPIVPLERTICDLNIDMVGRVDDLHAGKSENYLYLIGSDKLSSELHQISEDVNRKYVGMALDYKYNDPADPQRIYYRSDHYNFAKHKIPIIFYFNGLHADYHQPTDDVEKIDFKLAERSARLVFYTAWTVANRDKRLAVDSNKQ